MLSRTAAYLYWTGRYIERADFTARLVEATSRLASLAAGYGGDADAAWKSALACAFVEERYTSRHLTVSQAAAVHFLTLDPDNLSSIRSCIEQARSNARAVRTAFSVEAWEALNDAWHAVDRFGVLSISPARTNELVEATRHAAVAFDGSAHRTMLRSDAYWFLQLGCVIERADNTARLLDQKYHLLLPGDEPVGGSLDYFQWSAILRTVSGLPAYHVVYRDSVKPWLVADLLIFNDRMPRSLACCYREILRDLHHLVPEDADVHLACAIASDTMTRLAARDIDEVFADGLHEFLSDFIVDNNRLGTAVAEQFLFSEFISEEVLS